MSVDLGPEIIRDFAGTLRIRDCVYVHGFGWLQVAAVLSDSGRDAVTFAAVGWPDGVVFVIPCRAMVPIQRPETRAGSPRKGGGRS